MDTYKLHVRLGANEFNAEGDKATVDRQFEAFRALLVATPVAAPIVAPNTDVNADDGEARKAPQQLTGDAVLLERIFRRNAKKISLAITQPGGDHREADAALMLLLAHLLFNDAQDVGVTELKEGLRVSGFTVDRVDRIMERNINAGLTLRSGARRGVKFQLTNPGVLKATTLAKELRAQMP